MTVVYKILNGRKYYFRYFEGADIVLTRELVKAFDYDKIENSRQCAKEDAETIEGDIEDIILINQ